MEELALSSLSDQFVVDRMNLSRSFYDFPWVVRKRNSETLVQLLHAVERKTRPVF